MQISNLSNVSTMQRGGRLGKLLPEDVSCAETTELNLAAPPMAEELAGISARAVKKRRQEFAAGRDCARRALRSMGFSVAPIPVGQDGEPQWPEGVVGSITHSGGYAAAAVATAEAYAGLGIDVEKRRDLQPAVVERITSEQERRWIAGQKDRQGAVLKLFSAKESLHKLLQPLSGETLGFTDANVTEVGENAFRIEFRSQRRLCLLHGGWDADDGYVYAALWCTVQKWANLSA